jgi:hypothetical protein
MSLTCALWCIRDRSFFSARLLSAARTTVLLARRRHWDRFSGYHWTTLRGRSRMRVRNRCGPRRPTVHNPSGQRGCVQPAPLGVFALRGTFLRWEGTHHVHRPADHSRSGTPNRGGARAAGHVLGSAGPVRALLVPTSCCRCSSVSCRYERCADPDRGLQHQAGEDRHLAQEHPRPADATGLSAPCCRLGTGRDASSSSAAQHRWPPTSGTRVGARCQRLQDHPSLLPWRLALRVTSLDLGLLLFPLDPGLSPGRCLGREQLVCSHRRPNAVQARGSGIECELRHYKPGEARS